MAIRKKLGTGDAREPVGATVIETVDGATVVQGRYSTLAEAVRDLITALKNFESNKLEMARIIDAIDKQELYREENFASFAAYLPRLIEQCEAVGWKSGTSIKRYLAWYRLYVLELGYNASEALAAASHLHTLYRLADVDRKSGKLREEPRKDDKLGSVKFDDVARLVTLLVNGWDDAFLRQHLGDARLSELRSIAKLPSGAAPRLVVKAAGLGSDEVRELLEAGKLAKAADTYEEIVGSEIALPARGWTVANTQAIVDAIIKTDEDEGDDEAAGVEQVFVGYETHDGAVMVERIEWRGESGTVLESIEVGKVYTTSMFKKLLGKAKAEIAGVDGEQANEE